jgi:hypothetical protein
VLNNVSGEMKDKYKDINKQESANRDLDVQMQVDSKVHICIFSLLFISHGILLKFDIIM